MVKWIKMRAQFLNEYWESLCHGCGKCCYEKHFLPKGTLVIDFDRPCRFLNEDIKRCTVYVNRFNACRECQKITFWTALFSPALPPDCGYVVKIRGAFKHPLKTLKSWKFIRRLLQ
ncbi:hypothetical protein [Oceanispirochaeta sp.]|uniref:hypothetical protein n=1 Tax=Oceanispirochaeta sp. TaxID=2035350 RepID=UPI0026395BFD|nr:hypothetical protein [Oceanispirochaeta sp.]MDA3956307.1 hypothetical protein [Oceanispirochaeta sp.]